MLVSFTSSQAEAAFRCKCPTGWCGTWGQQQRPVCLKSVVRRGKRVLVKSGAYLNRSQIRRRFITPQGRRVNPQAYRSKELAKYRNRNFRKRKTRSNARIYKKRQEANRATSGILPNRAFKCNCGYDYRSRRITYCGTYGVLERPACLYKNSRGGYSRLGNLNSRQKKKYFGSSERAREYRANQFEKRKKNNRVNFANMKKIGVSEKRF